MAQVSLYTCRVITTKNRNFSDQYQSSHSYFVIGWLHLEYSVTVTKKCDLYTIQHPGNRLPEAKS